MNTKKEALQYWDSVQSRVSGWLNERQELIEVYCILIDSAKKTPHPRILPKTLDQFCVILMDYISAGHFEIYEELITESKIFNDGNVSIMDYVYPEIDETTELALNFNDKYETRFHSERLFTSLPIDLQALGQSLELRFELEDLLIEKLHMNHKKAVA